MTIEAAKTTDKPSQRRLRLGMVGGGEGDAQHDQSAGDWVFSLSALISAPCGSDDHRDPVKGSVGAGSAFARPARDASDEELTSIWAVPRPMARGTCFAECHKKRGRGLGRRRLPASGGRPRWVLMGFFRFRKTIPLGKFFRINVSKTGASVSVGRPGATVNVRKDRVDGTVGIPGSGLSYKERLSNRGCASVILFALVLAASLAGVVAWAR